LYKSAASSMAGCCDGDDTANCGWVNSCVDYTRYAGGSCGTSCLQDPFVMKCTNLANPYCVKYTYPGQSVSDFGCDSTSIFGALTIRQTASGGLGSTKVASTSLSTLTAGLDAAVTTDNSYTYTGGSGGTSGGTTTYNSDTYTTGKKKLAIGAIIGIVIAVLAIGFFVIIGIVMCLKKKKKQKQIDANARPTRAKIQRPHICPRIPITHDYPGTRIRAALHGQRAAHAPKRTIPASRKRRARSSLTTCTAGPIRTSCQRRTRSPVTDLTATVPASRERCARGPFAEYGAAVQPGCVAFAGAATVYWTDCGSA
jgi:hypothetical protein